MTGRRKTYCVYGSCQGPALGQTLDSCAAFSADWERMPLKPCHLVTKQELRALVADVLPHIDLLIYQPVSPGYRGELFSSIYLRSQLREGTPALSFPYLHWEGYMPSSTPEAWGLDLYPDIYVDVLVAEAARHRIGFDTFMRSYGDYGAHFQQQLGQIEDWGVAELRHRESDANTDTRATDITVSDYIALTWRQQLLFYTANHPSQLLFEEIARRMMARLGYAAPSMQFEGKVDPLKGVQLPILPRMGLHFPFRSGQDGWFGYSAMSPESYYQPMYNWFSSYPPDYISTCIARAGYMRPWVEAELALARQLW